MEKNSDYRLPHDCDTRFCMKCLDASGCCECHELYWHGNKSETFAQWNGEQHDIKQDTSQTLGQKAAEYLRRIADMVEAKNAAYGDSLGSPLRFFSNGSVSEIDLIMARMDDKVSRMMRGDKAGEDPEDDLILYGILAKMAGWSLTEFVKSKAQHPLPLATERKVK